MYYKITSLLLLMCGLSATSNAQLLRYVQDYKIGYKTAAGKVIIAPTYEAGSDMKEGRAVVLRGGKRGFIDERGAEVIPCQYDDATAFESGLACVAVGGRYGYIGRDGGWVLQPVYELAFPFSKGLARVYRGGKWGMIDPQGKVVIPFIYERLWDLSGGLIVASLDGQHYGYLNAAGQVKIDFQYRYALAFDDKEHRAIVTTEKGKYYINTQGRILEEAEDDKEAEEARERGERR